MSGVRAGYSLRGGGVSETPFDSFNLGDHVGDKPQAVTSNRHQLSQILQRKPTFLHQVHGWQVHKLPCPDATEADAVWCDDRHHACCIMSADCVAVLISDSRARMVAAAHAGWRGLCGSDGVGVIETLLARLQQQLPDAHWLAWLGPAIGPERYEVGDTVRQAFCRAQPGAMAHFRPTEQRPDHWHCDLAALVRDRLRHLGVRHISGNDSSMVWCTYSRSQQFFSYRRQGVCGRMAAVVYLT